MFSRTTTRIQELLKSEDHEEGRVPRTVECELTEDLVDACIPGDVVTVTGIIRVINNYMDIGGGKEILLALYVTSTSSSYENFCKINVLVTQYHK